MRGRQTGGIALVQLLAAVAIGAALAGATWLGGTALRETARKAAYPAELGRILAAVRLFTREQGRMPQLDVDAELWRRYYRPPAALARSASQALPDRLSYSVLRPFTPAGITTAAFPGRFRLTGSWCDRYDSDPAAFCEWDVQPY